MNKIDVSIITVIATEKEYPLIKDAIQSIYDKVEGLNYEIIISVNCNTVHHNVEKLKQDYPNFTILDTDGDTGFGNANNLGAKHATGKYLFMLNPDTILLNNAVKILFDFMENNPKCGACGSNLYYEDHKPCPSYNPLPSITTEIESVFNLDKKIIKRQFNNSDLPKKVGYVSGATTMMRRDFYEQLGGFDADFYLYYEDCELGYRIKKQGYDSMNVPSAKIIHLESQSTTSEYKRCCQIQTKRTYFTKTYGKSYWLIVKSIRWIKILFSLFVFGILRKKDKFDYWRIEYKQMLKLNE
ncbi:MAG: glycosyltransferase family 2 protein [Bacteroidales bacterium]|nr:glycosyltransferase family 2 protein [Bacteroidales bacterium]